jgi:hypothetical protein
MDPERPIEKLLQKAAETRRAQAGAPQELHPANRRLLQSEVARRFGGASQKRSFLDSLNLFMPRLAWGAAVLVGVGFAALLMLPRHTAERKEMFFAKNERAPSLQTANEVKPPGAAPAESSVLQEKLARKRVDKMGRSATGAASPEIAQADRERDSLSVERRRADSQKDLVLNAPTPQAPAGIGGALATAKQKEAPVMQPNSATTPPATPAPQENLLQRHYGFAGPAQAPSSSAVSSADASLAASPPLKPEMTQPKPNWRTNPFRK